MNNKIAFLCADPWEKFLSPIAQSRGWEYYQWICGQILLRKLSLFCQEYIEIYGETDDFRERELFSEQKPGMQCLYVQSCRPQLLEQVFEKSDLVIMGIPGCRKEFDKIYKLVFPWKDQIMFLWDNCACRGEEFFRRLCREYKLREAQIIEIRRNQKGRALMI